MVVTRPALAVVMVAVAACMARPSVVVAVSPMVMAVAPGVTRPTVPVASAPTLMSMAVATGMVRPSVAVALLVAVAVAVAPSMAGPAGAVVVLLLRRAHPDLSPGPAVACPLVTVPLAVSLAFASRTLAPRSPPFFSFRAPATEQHWFQVSVSQQSSHRGTCGANVGDPDCFVRESGDLAPAPQEGDCGCVAHWNETMSKRDIGWHKPLRGLVWLLKSSEGVWS